MAALNALSAFGTGGLTLNSNPGTLIPQGPSSPGFVQGTANTVKAPAQGVLAASTGPSFSGGGGAAAPSNGLFSQANSAAQSQANAQLSSLNTQYDQNAADLNGQLGSLGTQKDDALSSLETAYGGTESQVKNSKTQNQNTTDSNIQDALTTAQQVESANRNKLRALGILNSSAAGDELSKPLNAYDQQRATLMTNLQQRNSELDDFLNQKTSEHADAVKSIQSQYLDLVGKIQSDLRFNDRQRADAIQSANAALQQRMSDIQQAQFNYASQVQSLKTNLATQTAAQLQVQLPQTDTSGILGSAININPQQSQTAAIYQGQQNPNAFDPTKQNNPLSGLA